MSDLILCINFDESKKKNKLILETYEGIIPNLKSKKYSRQLRNININGKFSFNNLSKYELEEVRNILNNEKNIQFSKYQYIISKINFYNLKYMMEKKCLFYKEKKTGMYLVENILKSNVSKKNTIYIDECKITIEKTTLNIHIPKIINKENNSLIESKVYINIEEKNHRLELYFVYDDYPINFSENDVIVPNKQPRNFGFEQKIYDKVISAGWKYSKSKGFLYSGKDLENSIAFLHSEGIMIFTNRNKPISHIDTSAIRVSYDIDWFGIHGDIIVDNDNLDVSEMIDLRKKNKEWIEYNGKVLFIPKLLLSNSIKKDNDNNVIIEKQNLLNATELSYSLGKKSIDNIDKLISYDNISIEVDNQLKKTLRNYQKIGVKWLLSLKQNGYGACLADDMGLGKTLQIITFLSDKKTENDKTLIVVPKTLLINWQREFEKFNPNLNIVLYHGIKRNKADIKNNNIIITTYQTLLNDIETICKINFNNIILDEAQYIKNSRSKAYNAINSLKSEMKIALTGTPIENNLMEFWGLMKLLNPQIIGSYKSIFKNVNNQIDKMRVITSPFLLRRMKNDVLKDLPKKQEQVLFVKMEPEQQTLYNNMLKSIKHELERKSNRFEIKSNSIMLNGLLYLQEICCHPALLEQFDQTKGISSAKMELLFEVIEPLYEVGHKIVIFSRFTKMLKLIEKRLLREHKNTFYLDGQTKNRMNIIDEFEQNKIGIFLISLKAGGTGINLTSADIGIIYDPWWNPASEKQAEDRLYRIGQKNSVIIYRLITEGTIEEKVQELKEKKMDITMQLLEGHEVPTSITKEMMKKLLFD